MSETPHHLGDQRGKPAGIPAGLFCGESSLVQALETSGSGETAEICLEASDPLHHQIPASRALPAEFERSWPGDLEDSFRHSGWATHRAAIFESLVRTGQSAGRLDAFAKCGARCAVEYSASRRRYRVRGSYCHDRFCQPCARARGYRAAAAIAERVDGQRLRFITLTLKHSSDPLAEQIDRLRNSFALLRHRREWKDAVDGGVAVLEVKLCESGEWHPHLHILAEGEFIAHERLSQLWLQCTGDSFIVHLKDGGSDAKAKLRQYLVKYVSKPAGMEVLQMPAKLDEYVVAMKGQRVLNFLGTWRKWEKQADDAEKVLPEDWEYVAPLESLLIRERNGDPIAAAILEIIRQGTRDVAGPWLIGAVATGYLPQPPPPAQA